MKEDRVHEPEGFEAYVADNVRTMYQPAQEGDPALGPLKLLPGTWANIRPKHRDDTKPDVQEFKGKKDASGNPLSPFDGRGWNLIALPFARPNDGQPVYRLMMNQYNEVLNFAFVDDDVPNRGISFNPPPPPPQGAQNTDQLVAALDYTQRIVQIAATDYSAGGPGLTPDTGIHHEPGFFLHMKEQTINGFDVARLATIPHGNAATAIGRSTEFDGPPTIPPLSGMPEGVSNFDLLDTVGMSPREKGYLKPYFDAIATPFTGVLSPPFPGFKVDKATELLTLGMPQNVKKTTELVIDTDVMEGGIVNIPFIERQADAALMRSTFWIMEIDQQSEDDPRLVLAYAQFIFLDFFQRFDGRDGLIRWPHISINMMEKIDA